VAWSAEQHPELTSEELQKLQQQFGDLESCPLPCHLLSKTQALVGNLCKRPYLSKWLAILKDNQFLFTDDLNFPQASPFLAPLDRSMR